MRVGYVCGWRQYSEVELKGLAGGLDIILIAFAGINEEGGVTIDEPTRCLAERLQKLQVKVGLSIGGWTHRHQFKHLAALIKSVALLEFNLIDIDWEFDSLEEAKERAGDYARLISNLSAIKEVSCAIALNQLFLVQDYLPCLQFVTLMAYDQSGPWSATADHYAPYDAIKCLLPLGPKYLLGISLGRCLFYSCQTPGGPYSHCEIQPWTKSSTSPRTEQTTSNLILDAVRGSSYVIAEGTLIYEESEYSLGVKHDLAVADGLGGICLWDVRPPPL